MSALGSLLGIFVKPRATYESLATRPRILAPLVLVVLAQIALGVVLVQSGVIRNDAIAQMETKGTPPEQIAQAEQVFASPMMYVFGVLGPIVAIGFVLLIGAALLYFFGNLMLGARVLYRHYVCVAAYSTVVGLVDQGVRVGLGVSRGTLHVMLGLGAFLGDSSGFGVRILDSLTNPLLLWSAGIEALGVSIFARKGFGFGVLAVLPGFILLVLLSSIQQ